MPLMRSLHNLYRIRPGKKGRYVVELSVDDGRFWSVQCVAGDVKIARAVAVGYVNNSKIPARIID
jgi:hypothetical protein